MFCRLLFLATVFCSGLYAQETAPSPPPTATPAIPEQVTPAVASPTVVLVDAPPLAPVDVNSPYASPRDAARHRMQATLAALMDKRDLRAGLRGIGDALVQDRSYAPAVFNLAVLSGVAGHWDDAVAALEEAAKLDVTTFGGFAASQLDRWKLIATLEKTEEGRRRRRYDEALHPVLDRLAKASAIEAINLLASLGEIDPARWEAPALLGGLYADSGAYELSAKFLAIAEENAKDSTVKASLKKALEAATREVKYVAIRAEADLAADNGEHGKAAELYEQAWTVVPARADNGMAAASALLLEQHTAKAAALLARLQASGNDKLSKLSTAMAKELKTIEPAAGQASADAGRFFENPGNLEPVRIRPMLPRIDRAQMEILLRPMPKLVADEEPVLLLATLSADPAEASRAFLPALAEPRILGEQSWREVLAIGVPPRLVAPAAPVERQIETAIVSEARSSRLLMVKSEPQGAQVFLADRTDATCRTPCEIRIEPGTHSVRAALPGYMEQHSDVEITTKGGEASFPLQLIRGYVLVDTGASAALKVNGIAVSAPAPVELALLPGVHHIQADFGKGLRGRVLNVKAGARLRLRLQP